MGNDCHGKKESKTIINGKGVQKRKGQRQQDQKQVQGNQVSNDANIYSYSLSFKGELEDQLRTNRNTLLQLKKLFDDSTTFEALYSCINQYKLTIEFKSVRTYFSKVLKKVDQCEQLTIDLCSPYQFCYEHYKIFKITVLSVMYFLQKIDEGMREGILQEDIQFQPRLKQLKKHKPDISEKFQTVIAKQDAFRKKMAEKQQKIRRLMAEISFKDQLSIFNFLAEAARSQDNIADIIFGKIKKLQQQMIALQQYRSDRDINEFTYKIIDFSRRIQRYMKDQQNGGVDNQRIEVIRMVLPQKQENRVAVLPNETHLQKSEQMVVNTVSAREYTENVQQRKLNDLEIVSLENQQNRLRISRLGAENEELRKKMQAQQINLKRRQAEDLDQQARLIQQLTAKQNQIGRLKRQTGLLVKSYKDQIAKLISQKKSQNQGAIQSQKDQATSAKNQNLLLIQKQDDQINRLKSANAFLLLTQQKEVSRLKAENQLLTKTHNDSMARLAKENQSSIQIQKASVSQLTAQNLLLIQTHNTQLAGLKAQISSLKQSQTNGLASTQSQNNSLAVITAPLPIIDLHNKEIKSLQDKLDTLNNQKATLKIAVKSLDDQLEKLNKQKETLTRSVQRLQNHANQLEVSSESHGEEVALLKKEIRDQASESQKNLQALNAARQYANQLEASIKSHSEQVALLTKEIREQTSENQKNLQALNAARKQLGRKAEAEASLVGQMDSLVVQNSSYLKQLEEVNVSLQYETAKNTKLEEALGSAQKKIKQNQDERQRVRIEHEQAIKRLQKQLQEYKLSNQSMLTELEKGSSELSKMKQQVEREKTAAMTLKSKLDDNQITVFNLAQELNRSRQDASKLKKDNEQLIKMTEQEFDLSLMRSTPVKQRILFIGDLLQKQIKAKKFLYKSIERHMQRTIEKTKLLYEYQKDRLKNFHQVIDYHHNLVMIIRTEKALLASFYSGELTDKAVMTDEGLIISLTNETYYALNTAKNNPRKDPKDKRTMRGMVYDKFYYIIGNAEVRVKSGENTLFSNFGIAASYFDNRRDRVDALLGEGAVNEVPFINYEIHQVFFETQPVVLEDEAQPVVLEQVQASK